MIKLTLAEIIDAIRGKPRGDMPGGSVTAVATDSRSVQRGELFFALRGERFDGHAFVFDVLRAGAIAAVVEDAQADALTRELRERGVAEPRLIGVPDVPAALGRLGAYHRRQISATVIAVVGSNGKTTTKAMIDHVLADGRRGRCSPKSFNNAIGVPLTLLSAQAADEYLVVEIGTNAPGEIAALAALVQPDAAVLTSLSEEHLEGLRDLDGVASEECSVFAALSSGGFAAINIDAPQVRGHLPTGGATIVTFGTAANADLRVSHAEYVPPWLNFTLNGKFRYRLPIPGVHNALNAAGAVAVARRLGMEHERIAARLETFKAPPMRSELMQLGGVTLINDAYNANPRSALAAIDSIEAVPTAGRRIVVFGEMRELGARSAALHRQVAERLAGGRVDHVLLVGAAGALMKDAFADPRLFGPKLDLCSDVDSCRERLRQVVQDGDVVLLKGSRAVGLERLVEALSPAAIRAVGGSD
ncbi:MAG: UDP-N-acetylmuramoyl-tripeptide--D-alanyl-D-alanine ligase [Phycisphaerales bacterium]|nr:UDP-N-acetylmuramoyl-tripeptide--D-alanyl-D-alanine ligase [Phycisphaerales bacterium]